MPDLLILGTDTDVGKTAFALLWLAVHGERFEYWKPVETGPSDSERVRLAVPGAHVHLPILHLAEPVAPLLAARREGKTIPPAATIAAAKPQPAMPGRQLLIETFGCPLSPLDDAELQIALIQALNVPAILVASSSVGAIGRTLQCLHALECFAIAPAVVVLMGRPDPFAVEQLVRHRPGLRVSCLQLPGEWDAEGIARAAREQQTVLDNIARMLDPRGAARGLGGGEQDQLDILDRDRRYVWHPYTSLRDPDPPLVSVAAQDEFLWLADGRRLIDGISSWWTILHGHRRRELMAALADAARSFDHVHFAGVTHAPAVALAELLLGTAPWPGGRVFFSDNGSTAVEVALKMAYQFWCHQGQPQRTCFVGFEHGYHGDTFGAMSVGRDPLFFGRFEPLLFRAEIVPLCAQRLDEALARRPGEVAAAIVEPLVQGAGGMRMHTPAELAAIAEVTRRHGVLLIADEVAMGGGRTGWLWAHQAAGIAPDLIAAAKTLAGGLLPLAATLASPSVVAAWDTADASRTFFHGHSFTAHPLACAVAVANWRLLTSSPPSAPRRMEQFWNEALEPLRHDRRVREVRVRGSIAAVELDVHGGYLAAAGRQLRRACLERGVLLRPLGSVLYTMPPFCTSEDSLEQIAQAMLHAVQSLGDG